MAAPSHHPHDGDDECDLDGGLGVNAGKERGGHHDAVYL
jgi:hypothetical protein